MLDSGTRLGPYEIISPIGRGGMGEVYLGRDTRLDRSVAIKVLASQHGNDPNYDRRLEREAKTISQLQHPHICTLHDIGQEEGVRFLVMEHLEGETLDWRLRRGPLSSEEVLRFGRQIAEAVAAAHQRDIVHRDLKPSNVIFTESGVKVLDFGLAKALEDPDTDDGTQLATRTEPLTEEGSIPGTLHYMAPEQIDGQPADTRSDLWALGCVLYEMATEERPFDGEGRGSVIKAIVGDEPTPLSAAGAATPERLGEIVERCLEKNPERRWQSAKDLAIELESVEKRSGERTATVEKTEATTRPIARLALVVAALAALAAGLWWAATRSDGSSPSEEGAADVAALHSTTANDLAALPFESLGDDPALDQLARGIPEGVMAYFQTMRSAIPSTTSFRFAGRLPCEAAGEMGAGYVLVGSVSRVQDRVRATAQLIGCPAELTIWSEPFEDTTDDLFAAQDRLSQRIAVLLWDPWFNAQTTTDEMNPWFYIGQGTPEGSVTALELAEVYLKLDPDLGAGGLGTAFMIHLQRLMQGWTASPDATLTEMERLLEQCRALNEQTGCAQMRGFVHLFRGRGNESVVAFERLLEFANLDDWRSWLVSALAGSGRGDEALAVAEGAENPDNLNIVAARALAHFASGDDENAVRVAQDCVDDGRNGGYNNRAQCLQILTASLGLLGEIERAGNAGEEMLKLRPHLGALDIAEVLFVASPPKMRNRLIEGLRLAEVPERGATPRPLPDP